MFRSKMFLSKDYSLLSKSKVLKFIHQAGASSFCPFTATGVAKAPVPSSRRCSKSMGIRCRRSLITKNRVGGSLGRCPSDLVLKFRQHLVPINFGHRIEDGTGAFATPAQPNNRNPLKVHFSYLELMPVFMQQIQPYTSTWIDSLNRNLSQKK